MSTPGSQDDEARPDDPAAAQALPADAGVAAGGGDAPDAETQVHDTATDGDVAARAMGAQGAGSAAGGAAWTTGPTDVASDRQSSPPKASGDGPSGTAMGTPGGIPAGLADKLPVDAELLERKPELLVAGAFVGGFLAAKILRRIAGV